jgi:hypothetical protein
MKQKSAFHRITRLTKQFTPNSIFSFIQESWLFGTFAKQFRLISPQKILLKNYTIKGYQIAPKISYLFSKNTSWDVLRVAKQRKPDW